MEILQKTIEQIRKQYGLAGGILVAVKDGKVVLKECFGMADAEQNKPVDSKTLFQIASCSKAFTTMVAGQLCDEGKMTWDTPVKQLMPDFQMVDKYAEEPRHPARHGLPPHRPVRHDVMRTFVREDRADLVRRIAYFPPAFGFREKYSYQNQMYVALGYLCERLTGKTWEELLKERIGEPLGMDMYFRGIDTIEDKNAAMPYGQKDGQDLPRAGGGRQGQQPLRRPVHQPRQPGTVDPDAGQRRRAGRQADHQPGRLCRAD